MSSDSRQLPPHKKGFVLYYQWMFARCRESWSCSQVFDMTRKNPMGSIEQHGSKSRKSADTVSYNWRAGPSLSRWWKIILCLHPESLPDGRASKDSAWYLESRGQLHLAPKLTAIRISNYIATTWCMHIYDSVSISHECLSQCHARVNKLFCLAEHIGLW